MLTDMALRYAKGRAKQYKLSDSQGLYILVKPNGSRLWRLKYRFNGKEKSPVLGAYPEVGLIQARSLRDVARAELRDNKASSITRRQKRAASDDKRFLLTLSLTWIEHNTSLWTDSYRQHIVPHDANNPGLGTGKRCIDVMKVLEMKPVRALLPRCMIDRERCQRGIEALEQYRCSWDDANRRYRDRPLHDWASDYADAFRYLAVGLRDREDEGRVKVPKPRSFFPNAQAGWMGV